MKEAECSPFHTKIHNSLKSHQKQCEGHVPVIFQAYCHFPSTKDPSQWTVWEIVWIKLLYTDNRLSIFMYFANLLNELICLEARLHMPVTFHLKFKLSSTVTLKTLISAVGYKLLLWTERVMDTPPLMDKIILWHLSIWYVEYVLESYVSSLKSNSVLIFFHYFAHMANTLPIVATVYHTSILHLRCLLIYHTHG